jgi:hypothetical protein
LGTGITELGDAAAGAGLALDGGGGGGDGGCGGFAVAHGGRGAGLSPAVG